MRSSEPTEPTDGTDVNRRNRKQNTDSACDSLAYDLVKTRLSESEAEAEAEE